MEKTGCMDLTLQFLCRHRTTWFTIKELSKRLNITPQQAQTAIDNLRLKGMINSRLSDVMLCKEYTVVLEKRQPFLLQKLWIGVPMRQEQEGDSDEGFQAG